ncbi:MAG: hypothetical protein LBS91_09020, partial [Clostridiales Family XIII bacterium]|nr:hypothetical protein [Clostridiales Family XIII bacterium]
MGMTNRLGFRKGGRVARLILCVLLSAIFAWSSLGALGSGVYADSEFDGIVSVSGVTAGTLKTKVNEVLATSGITTPTAADYLNIKSLTVSGQINPLNATTSDAYFIRNSLKGLEILDLGNATLSGVWASAVSPTSITTLKKVVLGSFLSPAWTSLPVLEEIDLSKCTSPLPVVQSCPKLTKVVLPTTAY